MQTQLILLCDYPGGSGDHSLEKTKHYILTLVSWWLPFRLSSK